jgi:hypothetical protein
MLLVEVGSVATEKGKLILALVASPFSPVEPAVGLVPAKVEIIPVVADTTRTTLLAW